MRNSRAIAVTTPLHRILVAEDYPELAELIGEVLSGEGDEVTLVHDGLAAVTMLRQKAYNLLVLDMIMPELGGWAILDYLAGHQPQMLGHTIILTGDRGPLYSHSYYMLTIARLFADGRNQPRSNYDPRALGSSASKLLRMLDGTHYDVQATPHQKKMLRLWIESAAAYPGTYAALGCGMIGNYAENQQINTGADWAATKAASAVIQKRCIGCHDDPSRQLPLNLADERGVSFWQPSMDDPRLLTSRHIVFNLSRPEKSILLLAPLAKSAGGWGLCRDTKSAQEKTVFAATDDPGGKTESMALVFPVFAFGKTYTIT